MLSLYLVNISTSLVLIPSNPSLILQKTSRVDPLRSMKTSILLPASAHILDYFRNRLLRSLTEMLKSLSHIFGSCISVSSIQRFKESTSVYTTALWEGLKIVIILG